MVAPPKQDQKKAAGEPAEVVIQPLLLRRSVVFLALRLGILEVIFIAVFILLRSPIFLLGPGEIDVAQLYTINTTLMLTFLVAKVVLTLALALQWHNEYYEIHADRIVYKRGLVRHKENTYGCNNVQSVNLDQGFFGKILDFGTIKVFDPVLNKTVYLRGVSRPRYYLELLRDLLLAGKKEDVFIQRPG